MSLSFLDQSAASELTRFKTPWLVSDCIWTSELKVRQLFGCAKKQSILKLTDRDYNNNGMSDLLALEGSADLNINMFNVLQHTITGWPGGKPYG
jgi:glucosamine-6-phosphate deaminase